MKRLISAGLVLIVVVLLAALAPGQETREKQIERVQGAADVLNEIMEAPDRGIPEEIIGSAKCVAVVPSLMKGGFVFGAARGKGVASCRTRSGWSAPAFFTVTGGSFGLQIGGQAVDLVMLVMNDGGMRSLLSSKFKLGADASVAAGPIGRHAEGATDWVLRAQVLTYSRARGVFAGITVNGAVVKQSRDDTFAFYGRMIPHRVILTGGVPAPQDSQPYLNALARYSPVQPQPARATAMPVPSASGGN
jgi:SH3 domain-containing YSC84-like protein 1